MRTTTLAFVLTQSLAAASIALVACSRGGGEGGGVAGSGADAVGGHDSEDSGTAGGGSDIGAAANSGFDGGPGGAEAAVDGGWQASASIPPASSTSYTCAAEVHVATTGDDTAGNGTSGMPYKTIGKGVSMAMAAGTCVEVHAGTYAPAATISFPTDGMPGIPIVLRSADGILTAVIDGTGATTPVIQVDKDYVVVDGFDFENTPLTAGAFPVRFDGQYNSKCEGSVIRNSKLSGGFSALKIYQNSHGVLVENNEFYGGTANSTASLTGASGLVFRSNVIHDIDTGDLGTIELVGGSTGSLFEKNVFQNISSAAGALVFGDDGCGSTCDNDPEHYSAVNAKAWSNIFIRVGRAMDVQGCKSCSILANTIIDAGGTYGYVLKIGSATTNGVTQPTTDLRVLDDLFASPNGVMGYVVSVSGAAGTGLDMDYNLFYNGPNAIQFNGAYPTTADAHSVRSDPLLVGPTDLHPGEGSPAIGAGMNLFSEVPEDLLNVARPATGPFDIGALQH